MSDSPENASITVIGGGVIGLTCALQLQRQGMQVTMIDPSGEPESLPNCSYGNAGHFAIEQVNPLANWAMLMRLPKMLLDPQGPLTLDPAYFVALFPWLVRFLKNAASKPVIANQSAIAALNRRALSDWQTLLETTGGQSLIRQNGHLLVFEHSKTGQQVYRKQQLLQDLGVNCEWLSDREVYQNEPNVSDSVKCAIRYPDTAFTLSPQRLMAHLQDAFIQSGGRRIRDHIDSVDVQATGIQLKGDKPHRCHKLLIAAGAWSHLLSRQLGYKVPLETERGYHVTLPEFDQYFNSPVASYERSFIMTPMSDGLRLAGTVELAGLKRAPNYKRADKLVEHAKAITRLREPLQKGKPWMGFRPSLPDSLPVLGRAPHHPNVFFAFGHHHLGLTQAAVTAKLMAQHILFAKTEIDLTPYSLQRF